MGWSTNAYDPAYDESEDEEQQGKMPQPSVITPPAPSDNNTPKALPDSDEVADTVSSDASPDTSDTQRSITPRAGRVGKVSADAVFDQSQQPGEDYASAIQRSKDASDAGLLGGPWRPRFNDPGMEAQAQVQDQQSADAAATNMAQQQADAQNAQRAQDIEDARQQAAQQKAVVAHHVAAWKDQGVVLQHNPDGTIAPATRDDGSEVYEPKTYGPFQWTAQDGGDGKWYQDVRDDRGQMTRHDILADGSFHTDPNTGEQSINLKGYRQPIGTDPNVAKVNEAKAAVDDTALQDAQIEAALQEKKVQLQPMQEQLRQAQIALNPKLAEKNYEAAKVNFGPGGATFDADQWNQAQQTHADFLAKYGPIKQQVDQQKADIQALESSRAQSTFAKSQALSNKKSWDLARKTGGAYGGSSTPGASGVDNGGVADDDQASSPQSPAGTGTGASGAGTPAPLKLQGGLQNSAKPSSTNTDSGGAGKQVLSGSAPAALNVQGGAAVPDNAGASSEPGSGDSQKLYHVTSDGVVKLHADHFAAAARQAYQDGVLNAGQAGKLVGQQIDALSTQADNGVSEARNALGNTVHTLAKSTMEAFAGIARMTGMNFLAEYMDKGAAEHGAALDGKAYDPDPQDRVAVGNFEPNKPSVNPGMGGDWGTAGGKVTGEIGAMVPSMVATEGMGPLSDAAGLTRIFKAMQMPELGMKLAGQIPMALQMAGQSADQARTEAMKQGKTGPQADAEGMKAAIDALPGLAVFGASGELSSAIVGKAAKVLPILQTPFRQALATGITATAGNVAASTALRVAGGGDASGFTAQGVGQDVAWGLISGKHAYDAAKYVPTAQALADGSHPELQLLRSMQQSDTLTPQVRAQAAKQADSLQQGAVDFLKHTGAPVADTNKATGKLYSQALQTRQEIQNDLNTPAQTSDQITQAAQQRLAELEQAKNPAPTPTGMDKNGKPLFEDATSTAPKQLSFQDESELAFLRKNASNPTAVSERYGLKTKNQYTPQDLQDVDDHLHVLAQGLIQPNPEAASNALKTAGLPSDNVQSTLNELKANPVLARGALTVGDRMRAVLPGAGAAENALAEKGTPAVINRARTDQLLGAHAMLKYLPAVENGQAIPQHIAGVLESCGLIQNDGSGKYKLREDAIPFLPDKAREAAGNHPDKVNLYVSPSGPPGAVAGALVDAGEAKITQAMEQAGKPEHPKWDVAITHSKAEGGKEAPTPAPVPQGTPETAEPQAESKPPVAVSHDIPEDARIQKVRVSAPDEATARHIAERAVIDQGSVVHDSEAEQARTANESGREPPLTRDDAVKLFNDALRPWLEDLRKIGFRGVTHLPTDSPEAPAGGIAMHPDGRMLVNFDNLAQNLTGEFQEGQTPADQMAEAMREEAIHALMFDAMHKGKISSDEISAIGTRSAVEGLSADEKKAHLGLHRAAAKAYGGFDNLTAFQKGSEILRMVLTGKYAGKLTEAVYKAIQKLIPYFKSRVESLPSSSLLKGAVDRLAEHASKLDIDLAAPRNAKPETVPEPAPETSTVEKKPGKTQRQPPPDGGYTEHPVIKAIMDAGGIMSRTTAKAKWGAAKYAQDKGIWDDAPSFSDPRHNKIYGNAGLTPDEMAQHLVNDGLLPEHANAHDLWAQVQKISDGSKSIERQERARNKTETDQAQKTKRFEAAAFQPQRGETPINASDLRVGDSVKVGTETMKVSGIDPDTFDVMLEDGTKFGIQHVEDGKVFYGEIVRAAPRLRGGEKQGDLLSGQREDLSLAGERGTDWEARSKAKEKAESDAAAATALQEKQQGTLFAAGRKVDGAGIHPLAKPTGEAYKNPDDKLRDPASILDSIAHPAGGGADARQPWKHGRPVASHAEALDWARENGRDGHSPRLLDHAFAAGGEHVVAYDPQSHRVVKATKPGLYGAQGDDAGAYLQRMALHNRLFGDDTKFEGFTRLNGEDEPRAVISQPFREGRDSTAGEQQEYLRGKGFRDQGNGKWIHPTEGVTTWDTHTPGNAITDEQGNVHPIDLQAAPSNAEELKEAQRDAGTGGDTLFAAKKEDTAAGDNEDSSGADEPSRQSVVKAMEDKQYQRPDGEVQKGDDGTNVSNREDAAEILHTFKALPGITPAGEAETRGWKETPGGYSFEGQAQGVDGRSLPITARIAAYGSPVTEGTGIEARVSKNWDPDDVARALTFIENTMMQRRRMLMHPEDAKPVDVAAQRTQQERLDHLNGDIQEVEARARANEEKGDPYRALANWKKIEEIRRGAGYQNALAAIDRNAASSSTDAEKPELSKNERDNVPPVAAAARTAQTSEGGEEDNGTTVTNEENEDRTAPTRSTAAQEDGGGSNRGGGTDLAGADAARRGTGGSTGADGRGGRRGGVSDDLEPAPSVAELIRDNIGLAHSIAGKYHIPGTDPGDVAGEARMGLVKAARNYEPERGPFDRFAARVIRNHLNDVYSREKERDVHESVTLDDLIPGSDAASHGFAGTSETNKDRVPDNNTPNASNALEHAETAQAVRAQMARLPERVQAVLQGVTAGRTLEELGNDKSIFPSGMTKAGVGRIKDSAYALMRGRMKEAGYKGQDSDGVLFAATRADVDREAHAAATSPLNELPHPTDAQKEAGNYQKGHVDIGGMDISIENPAGSERQPEWPALQSHYGYIRGTVGADKDHVDVFIKPGTPEDWHGDVYVVNQNHDDGTFDEQKAVIGAGSETEARDEYLKNYEPGQEQNVRSIARMPLEDFKKWAAGTETGKPAEDSPSDQRLNAATRDAERLRGLLTADKEGKKMPMAAGDSIASPEVEERAKKDTLVSAENRLAESLGKKTAPKPLSDKESSLLGELDAMEGKVDKLSAVKESAQAVTGWLKRAAHELTHLPEDDPYKRAVNRYTAKLQASELEVLDSVKNLGKSVPDKLTREAITNYRVAGGNETKLRMWANLSSDPKLKAGYEKALTLTDEQKDIAASLDAYYKSKLALGQDRGMLENGVHDYATQIWRDANGKKLEDAPVKEVERDSKGVPLTDENGEFIHRVGRKFQQGFDFANPRTFDDFFTGESLGYHALTKDCASLLGIYGSEFNRTLALREFVKELTDVKAPDGKPIVGTEMNPRILRGVREGEPADLDTGAFNIERPESSAGYKQIDHAAFQNWKFTTPVEQKPEEEPTQEEMALADDRAPKPAPIVAQLKAGALTVHPDFASRFHNLVGSSGVRTWAHSKGDALSEVPKAIVRGLDWSNKEVKALTFVGSPFHLIHLAKRASGYGINPFTHLDAIDTENPLHRRAMLAGLMVAPDQHGLNRWMDGLGRVDGTLAGKIPGVQWMSNMLFHEYIPRLKMKGWISLTDRMLNGQFKADVDAGRISTYQVENYAARIINNAFGHLNIGEMGGLMGNPTMRHLMSFGLLAPDFLQSTGQHFIDAGKGLIPGSQVGRQSLRSIAALALGVGFVAKSLNKLIDGNYHWDHPFSIIVGTREYSIRSQPTDLQLLYHDPRAFAFGRISPLARAMGQLLTMKNYRGEQMSYTDQARDWGASWLPATLRALPPFNKLSPTDAARNVKPLEQLSSALGLKVSRYSATREVNTMADDFLKGKGKENTVTYPASRFTPLKNALADGDAEEARAEFKSLVAAAKTEDVRKAKAGTLKGIMDPVGEVSREVSSSIFHPVIADAAMLKEFVSTLSGHQKELFVASMKERLGMWRQYQKVSGSLLPPKMPGFAPAPASEEPEEEAGDETDTASKPSAFNVPQRRFIAGERALA